jgi:hypothetical protein
MAAQQFANNAQTTLASNVGLGDVSISVVSAAGFPTQVPYTILIDSEFMLVTSGASTTTWGVSRGQEGTSAGTHTATTAIEQVWTVAGLQSLNQAYFPYWAVAGLTGALQPSRYIGATGTGTPGSGTFQAGDWGIAQTGALIICTVAGTPGTWVTIAPQNSNNSAHIVSLAPGPPTTSVSGTNMSSAVMGANSTDTKGTINFTVSASPVTTGQPLCTVSFNTAYGNANYSVQLSISSTGSNQGWFPAATSKATTGFEIWNASSNSINAGDTFSVDYLVIG